ncbi:hypothetical protein BCR34DRAFT_564672 [Clohesyomyces aquaticus]|uniref:Uncharacterized protein n=1 Tax=Clohesyomyces aquaticus TaxID=1231657 RepID=A0A1Y1ZNK3_9PLEO|nr:hypothetical protein BCR34DRAFT_564672 [Clohesyomyces aquaticus]
MGLYLKSLVLGWLSNYKGQPPAHPKDHISERNLQESRLYQLPTELVRMIDEYLLDPSKRGPNVYKMAFRATCRRFYTMFPSERDAAKGERDRRAYSQLIKLAAFRTLCEEEKNAFLPKNHLVCCNCRATHETSCFTPFEQKRSPEGRVCIGTQGVLEVCPHIRLTYGGLKVGPISFLCNRKHNTMDLHCGKLSLSQISLTQVGDKENREVKVLVKREFFAIADPAVLTRDKVVQATKAIDWKLCPHMHTKDVEVWPKRFTNGVSAKPFLAGGRLWMIQWGFTWCWEQQRQGPLCRCETADCDTRYQWVREIRSNGKGGYSEFLVVQIERYLGKMEKADDKRWMAQIEAASALDEDSFRHTDA